MSVYGLKRITKSLAVTALILMGCRSQSAVAESSVYGRVTDLRGQPISNVVVRFYKLVPGKLDGGEMLLSEVAPDETGYYEATGLDWGRYRIHFGELKKSPYLEDQDIWGFFVSNGSRHVLNVALAGGMSAHLGTQSRVRGVVKDEQGTQMAGATVVIVPVYGPNQYRQTHTEESGEFSYFIENGSYLIYATAPGAVSEPILFKTRGRSEKTFVLQLMPDS